MGCTGNFKRALYGNGDSPTSADLNGSFGNSMNNRRWYFLRLAVGNACEYVKDPSRLPIRVPQSKTVLYHWRSWRKHPWNHSKPFSTIAEVDEKTLKTRIFSSFFLNLKKKIKIFFFRFEKKSWKNEKNMYFSFQIWKNHVFFQISKNQLFF